MERNAKIFVAGHGGMVGSAIVRRLQRDGYQNLILKTSQELDLRNQPEVKAFFEWERPAYVFLAAAHVGGILANSRYPADFLYDNLMLELNVVHCALESGVKKLLFLGSSCIYPRMAPQPIPEESLLAGPLERTNEGYALAKISGLRYCAYLRRQYGADFISVMPPNLYGPNDNYHPENSHVLPAMIRRFCEAKQAGAGSVVIWGTGTPLREFMYVDDLADASLFLMERYSGEETINVGTGREITIRQLAETVGNAVGFQGEIVFDPSKPDGTPRKLLDSSRLSQMGWRASTDLREGIRLTVADYLAGGGRRTGLRERAAGRAV